MRKQGLKLHMDDALIKWLQKEAARRHCSVSQVMRDLVVAEMERRKP